MFSVRWFGIAFFLWFISLVNCARAEDIALEPPDGFVASSIDRVGNAQYCVTGEIIDDMKSTKTAWVALVDFFSEKVVWKTALPFASPYSGNYALRCTAGRNAFYVLTGEQTQTEENLAQTKLKLNKLSRDGKILISQPVNAGFDEWGYFLATNADEITVAGGSSDRLQRKGVLNTFLARFDDLLKRTAFISMDSGAFWTDTKAMTSANELRVAGRFMPNLSSSTSGQRAFAVSEINVDTKRYTFSTYVSPPVVLSEATNFGKDGSAYYVAATGDELIVSVILPNGKIGQHFLVKSTICDLKAIEAHGTTMNLVGSTCNPKSGTALTTIDLTKHRTISAQSIKDEVTTAYLGDESWIILTNKTGRGIVLRRGSF